MTRREALMAVLATTLAQVPTLGQTRGILTIPLDQWTVLRVTRGGKEIRLMADEVFEVLSGEGDE